MRRRSSQQRSLILSILQNSSSHPSAEDVYHAARQTLPRISLGTVYRNLEVLCDQGCARVVECNDHRRYDGDMSPHCHIKCRECGRIDDVPASVSPSRSRDVAAATGYTVESCTTIFTGLCPACTHRNTN